jgi:hypothetical protein
MVTLVIVTLVNFGDGDIGEFGDGDIGESGDGDIGESGDGDTGGESGDGDITGESGDGDITGESGDGGIGESSDGDVGESGDGDTRRLVFVRASMLGHPIFADLLRRSGLVFGFSRYDGPLRLPCELRDLESLIPPASSSSANRPLVLLPECLGQQQQQHMNNLLA